MMMMMMMDLGSFQHVFIVNVTLPYRSIYWPIGTGLARCQRMKQTAKFAIWSDMVAPIRHILKMLNFVCPKLEPKCSSCWIFRTHQEIPSWLWSSHWSDSQQSSDCLGASDLKGITRELSPVGPVVGRGSFLLRFGSWSRLDASRSDACNWQDVGGNMFLFWW